MILTDEILLQYKRCRRKAFLNFYGAKEDKPPEKDFVGKLKQEKITHNLNILKHYSLTCEIPKTPRKNQSLLREETLSLMKKGVNCIYGGQLSEVVDGSVFIISPTLLIKQENSSNLGDWSYITVNGYLGKNHKPEYKLIAAFQAFVLGKIQGLMPLSGDFILRSFKRYQVNLRLWLPRVEQTIAELQQLFYFPQEPEVFISRQKCSLCEWYDQCHAIAVEQNHLSLIPGITPKKYSQLTEEGIKDFESLSQLSLEKLHKLIDHENSTILYKQIQSLQLNQPIKKREDIAPIPSSNIELYFDIEAEPERNVDYLLGVILVDYEKNKQEYYGFLAENLEEEKIIWEQFLKLINSHSSAFIYHFSEYEVETIKRLARIYETPQHTLQLILKRFVDIHKFVTQNYLLPVESYSLKSLGSYLEFKWRNPETGKKIYGHNSLGGDQCVVWYDRWLATGDRTYLKYILTYNEDDCLATFEVKKWLNSQQLTILRN